jgi:hypothetical protein
MSKSKNIKRSVEGINQSNIYSVILQPRMQKDRNNLTMFELKQFLIGGNSK